MTPSPASASAIRQTRPTTWPSFRRASPAHYSTSVDIFIVQPGEHGAEVASEQRFRQCFLVFAVAPLAIAVVQGVDHHCLARTLIAALTDELAHRTHQVLKLRDSFRR